MLTLEVLNIIIRYDGAIRGAKIKGEEYKIQAFADDLVFILEDPIDAINILMSIWQEYGEVAGMKANQEKTKIICKNMKAEEIQELLEKTQFKQEKCVKCLGINMTNKSSTLMEYNYLKLLRDIQKDLEKWDKLQLSLLGRIAAIKMNILPRVLFLFQTIPIILKQSFFQDLNKITSNFI